MKIVVLQGSPNLDGSTAILCESFAKGAREAGHSVQRLDLARLDIRPCTGCVACGYEGPCVQHDDNWKVRDALLSAGMAVFASPLYYYGFSAQMKTVIDRFCSRNSSLTARRLKSALISVAWNALEAHYRTLVRYLDMDDRGMILGKGCGTPSMTRRSRYPELAYELGRRL